MAFVVNLPKLGLTMTEATVMRWLKSEGSPVGKGEILFEFETDKISNEFESPQEGFLLKILAGEGDVVAVAEPVCIIGQPGEDIAGIDARNAGAAPAEVEPAEQPVALPLQEERSERVFISPAARRLAQEHGIDYERLATGMPGGRIDKEDVEKAIAALRSVDGRAAVFKKIPISEMRRTIAERLSRSKKEIPHTYFKTTIDMSNTMEFKSAAGKTLLTQKGLKLTLNHIIIKAAAKALEENPILNVSFAADGIIAYEEINIGMAVEIEGGLVVPVIRYANRLSLEELCAQSIELTEKARSASLSAADVSGGTFTVTNLGMYGLDEFTAIIRPPEAAILAVGAVKERPVVIGGSVIARPTALLTLSVDHRVIDGGAAARFLAAIERWLMNPSTL